MTARAELVHPYRHPEPVVQWPAMNDDVGISAAATIIDAQTVPINRRRGAFKDWSS